MTKRGSLTYYFAAVVVGCFFASAGYALFGRFPQWHGNPAVVSSFREFFYVYFLSIPFGGFSAIVFAFVLRRVASAFRFRSGPTWAAAGAVLAPGLIWASFEVLELIRRYGGSSPVMNKVQWAFAVLLFSSVLLVSIWWVMIPAGIATAFVLFLIQRAFQPSLEQDSLPEQP